jgi:secondary thiamine-phosphate synthase enzyme
MEQFEIRTAAHECMVDITVHIQRIVSARRAQNGICSVFVPHTTAGLTINENADPTVQSDLLGQLSKIVPWHGDYDHSEGNAAAHVKSSLLGQSHSVIISGGILQLGTWQGIFLVEFDGPRTRKVWVEVFPA